MRSALLCVFIALIVHKEGSLGADEDFRPTPIPLNEWNSRGKGGNAGTLQEIIATDAPPAAAAIPAHYWEDALRHSVYLTLVRDKIDQLIAKGSVITPDGKPDQQTQKNIDDHDLWDKIKTAPFDRLNAEEPSILGDITVMSKGRLLEEQNGLRFTEDEISKEKCNEEKCNEGVKAYWSVKRVRQRDAETTPGKYHYELTFSVSSQTPKKQKRPYDNPVRTFTVREGTPVEKPQYRFREPVPHAPRPQRAIWFHKNIVPTPPHQSRKQEQGLDRLFSSWFSSEEEPPKRYKQVSYVPQMYPQRSKVGDVGVPTEHYQHHQKPQMPYPYKPQPQTSYKYSRPPLGPPPVSHPHTQHRYIDYDAIRNQNQYTPPQSEYNYLSSNIVKTTKPAVLPTPPISYEPLNITMEVTHNMNVTEITTRDPEIITAFTMYSKPKLSPTKVSYFPEHVRPPVFNAPPGVFVTMDKKPFKPMPPLKYMHTYKSNKNKPIDFRPSPQVLDVQFSDPDPLSDAFRPITMSYAGNTTEASKLPESHKDKPQHPNQNIRKSKPPKKHENIKPHRITTNAPDIITAHNEDLDEMHWANILGAFVKTTPMISQKMNVSETTTPMPSTTVSSTTTVQSKPSTTEAVSITTPKSKPRRTRPPPKFTKPVKVKKHKRVTSTTTTSTTTTTTEKLHHRRPLQDLTPQASSAATETTKSGWQPKSKIQNATLSTTSVTSNITNVSVTFTTPEPSIITTKIIPTTYRALTTTRQKTTTMEAPNTTTEITTTIATTNPKSKNRFRQSALMQKGTSVNHDKWSSPYVMPKNKTIIERIKPVPPLSGKYPRRKGSNFQGYVSSTPKTIDEERNREDHIDHVFNPNLNVISLSSASETTNEAVPITTPKPMQAAYEESAEPNDDTELDDPSGTEDPDDGDGSEEAGDESEASDEQETKDHDEYIFDTPSGILLSSEAGKKSNEIEPVTVTTTEETIVTSPHSVAKNKTKCKKKNQNNAANNQTQKSASDIENEVSVAPIETTTEKLSTADFFDQIFGLNLDQNETDGNRTESKYVDNDEDLEEFLESINGKKESNETNDEEYEDDDKNENENSPFNNDEENRYPRNADASYEDYQDRPFSFLELMAME